MRGAGSRVRPGQRLLLLRLIGLAAAHATCLRCQAAACRPRRAHLAQSSLSAACRSGTSSAASARPLSARARPPGGTGRFIGLNTDPQLGCRAAAKPVTAFAALAAGKRQGDAVVSSDMRAWPPPSPPATPSNGSRQAGWVVLCQVKVAPSPSPFFPCPVRFTCSCSSQRNTGTQHQRTPSPFLQCNNRRPRCPAAAAATATAAAARRPNRAAPQNG